MPTILDVEALQAQNPVQARRLCAELARSGDCQAMQQLGRWHAAGECGCQRDPGLAAYWFFQAWQGGLDAAEQDIVRVRADLETAAEGGSAEAQNSLGLLLCFGQDDPASAAEWFERAAEQNHAEALRTLGFLVESGRGAAQSDARAATLFRRAAELGDPFGQFNYAMMLASGRGHAGPNRETAIHWLEQALNQGMAEAKQPLDELLAERARTS